METETTQQEVTQSEKHYGKEIAITAVGVLVVVGVIYGAFSWGGSAGKVAYVAPQKETPVVIVTTPVVSAPTEVFVITDTSTSNTGAPAKTTGAINTKMLTAPTNFKSFAYDATLGKMISVSGTCHDTYYALLIFDAKDDYRTNPGSARSNRAFECGASKLFTIKMDLRDINLASGSYYLFVADQGSKGSWYNPR